MPTAMTVITTIPVHLRTHEFEYLNKKSDALTSLFFISVFQGSMHQHTLVFLCVAKNGSHSF